MQRQEKVGADFVGPMRTFGVVWRLVRTMQEVRLQPRGQQPCLEPRGKISHEVTFAQIPDGDPRIFPAVPGVDRDHDSEQGGTPLEQSYGLPEHIRAASDNGSFQLLQLPQRQRSAAAIRLQSPVVLEVLQRRLRLRAEDAVRPPHVESHVRQPFL